MSSRLGHYAGLFLLAGLALGFNLGGAKLWDRDEPRNAACAAEMLQRGDWIVPVLNSELRAHKPVLLYWFILASYSILGISEWSARLPSALLGVGTVLCTYEIGRRLFSPRAGWWAGVTLATSLLFVMAGRAATPDAALIFFATLAMTVFVLNSFPRQSAWLSDGTQLSDYAFRGPYPNRWTAAAAMYGAMGAAVLAKGPVGLVLPTAVIGLFLLIAGRAPLPPSVTGSAWWRRLAAAAQWFEPSYFLKTCWSMRPLTALVVSLAVAAPWYVWVGVRTGGAFPRIFFLEHHLGRAMQAMEGHRGNLLFYPLAILAGCFPWSVLAAPLILDTRVRLRRGGPCQLGYVLASAWIGVYVGAFSLAQTKLPSYITPCFPAVALLAGSFIDRWSAGDRCAARGWLYATYTVLSLTGLVAGIAIPFILHDVLPGEEWLGAIGLIPAGAGLFGIWAVRQRMEHRATWGLAFAAAAMAVLLFGVATERVSRHQQYDQLFAAIRSSGSQRQIAAFGILEPSWIFYGGQTIEELSRGPSDSAPTRWVEVAGQWVSKPRFEFDELVSRPGNLFVLTTDRELEHVRSALPADFEVITSVPHFLRRDRVLLLGRPNSALTRRPTNPAEAQR